MKTNRLVYLFAVLFTVVFTACGENLNPGIDDAGQIDSDTLEDSGTPDAGDTDIGSDTGVDAGYVHDIGEIAFDSTFTINLSESTSWTEFDGNVQFLFFYSSGNYYIRVSQSWSDDIGIYFAAKSNGKWTQKGTLCLPAKSNLTAQVQVPADSINLTWGVSIRGVAEGTKIPEAWYGDCSTIEHIDLLAYFVFLAGSVDFTFTQ